MLAVKRGQPESYNREESPCFRSVGEPQTCGPGLGGHVRGVLSEGGATVGMGGVAPHGSQWARRLLQTNERSNKTGSSLGTGFRDHGALRPTC